MIVSSLFFCITTICFLREFKLGKTKVIYKGFIIMSGDMEGDYSFCICFYLECMVRSVILVLNFVTFLLFIFLGNSRMDFFYKQKYYGLKINSEISLSEINITKRLWYICRIGKCLSLICVVILAFVLLF